MVKVGHVTVSMLSSTQNGYGITPGYLRDGCRYSSTKGRKSDRKSDSMATQRNEATLLSVY